MKPKYLFIPLIFVIVAVLGFLVFHTFKWGKEDMATPKTNDEPIKVISKQGNIEKSSVQGSIFDVIAEPGDRKCTWGGTVQDGVTIQGTVYISSGKARSEVVTNSTAPKKTFTSYSIVDGGSMTTWSDLMPQNKTVMSIKDTQPEGFSDFSQQYHFVCEPWVADQSFFVVPR